jgi:hypothetical protein
MIAVSVTAVLGNGDPGGLLVDDGLVPGERGGECVDREIMHGSWVAGGGVMDDGDGVRAAEGVGPAGDFEVFGCDIRRSSRRWA